MKFSESVCVALVASLTEEMAAQSIASPHLSVEQQTVTNSAVIHGLCAMTLNQAISNALLAQARPHNDKSSD